MAFLKIKKLFYLFLSQFKINFCEELVNSNFGCVFAFAFELSRVITFISSVEG